MFNLLDDFAPNPPVEIPGLEQNLIVVIIINVLFFVGVAAFIIYKIKNRGKKQKGVTTARIFKKSTDEKSDDQNKIKGE